MTVMNLSSIYEFKNFIKSNDLSVICFYAPWADQCTQMNEILEQMTDLKDYKNVKFAKIIAEDFPEIAIKYNISAVPTTLLLKNENIVLRINGVNPTIIEEQIKKQVTLLNEAISISDVLEEKLKNLINKAPCMLFIKGSRKLPQCGFSKSAISLLDEFKADYETFDILENNEIREGLKKFSNWPTYPQLYVKGKLIGGLDIIKEMSKSGELSFIIPKKIQQSESLETKLKNLINKAPCMLFMKGNQNTPQCGFSKAIVKLLQEHQTEYQTFDILEDNEVREGLKKYSNWPTYPQLYIKGEFIGGLDIIKEMSESGNLDIILPKKK